MSETICTMRAFDAIRLRYRRYEPEPCKPIRSATVVCLAGISRSSLDFTELASRLCSDGFRVLCPDYRGRGLSDYARRPLQDYKAPVYLEDLRHLCTIEQCDAIIIIGTSLGGILAMCAGITMPGLVRGVVLNDIGPTLEVPAIQTIASYIGKRHEHQTREQGIALLQQVIPADYFDDEASLVRLHQNTFIGNAREGYQANWDPAIAIPLQKTALMTDLWRFYRSLNRIPILAVRGANSRVLSRQTLLDMQDQHPDCTVIEVANRGHVPFLDEAELIQSLPAFLHRIVA
ncbi:MAG: alpha/beta fold hydrolase [Pseudomonadota bacterium]